MCVPGAIFSRLNSWHWAQRMRPKGVESQALSAPRLRIVWLADWLAGVAMAAYYFIAARINLANADKKNTLYRKIGKNK